MHVWGLVQVQQRQTDPFQLHANPRPATQQRPNLTSTTSSLFCRFHLLSRDRCSAPFRASSTLLVIQRLPDPASSSAQ